MKNLPEILDRYMEAKEELNRAYDFQSQCPDWRYNTLWANLLILIGNEYAPGIEKTLREREETVKAICRRADFAEAIRNYKPVGMGRNKQVVAFLTRRRLFHALTLLYKLKNHM